LIPTLLQNKPSRSSCLGHRVHAESLHWVESECRRQERIEAEVGTNIYR